MNCLIFIETRILPNIREIFEQHHEMIPEGWDYKVVCSDLNKHLFEGYNLEIIRTFRSVTEYNYFITSLDFWSLFTQYENVLFTEHESGILRYGIDEFLEYDYVGAPWAWQQEPKFGGNGGFSLRSVNKCTELVKRMIYKGMSMGNCDVFFTNNLHFVGGKVAPYEVCRRFSVEAMFELNTFGYHAISSHLTPDQCEKIKKQYY